ncbi:GNAT family N-acetyltransferase [Pelagimonas varians]|uniref:Aminoalkylphosphonic acid N-acetyltransferase n=1 Tax=Pelagimonas varians TaxID=696760 RepID=A0A238KCI3_9RHOB|nr:GNAT family N-acetyltransferase [Pelagimonas varians]PYG31155.1 acetyltransferase (GNAT) family protein [Pelagimonas varians]SMX39746.1 aminoalkylphosphonic acid N-acetyltransferase [Pelagimonas varians]
MIRIETLEDPTPALPVLRELRGTIGEKTFQTRLQAAQKAGYQMMAAFQAEDVVGVLGYRIVHDICWGQTFFIDDLVVTALGRGHGVGGALLGHATQTAHQLECDHIRLCSGLTRVDAHRFYEAHGMTGFSKQFVLALNGGQ